MTGGGASSWSTISSPKGCIWLSFSWLFILSPDLGPYSQQSQLIWLSINLVLGDIECGLIEDDPLITALPAG